MISIDEKSIIKTIKIYLGEYRSIFTERSFEIFYLLITAMLSVQEVRSIKFLYDNFISRYWEKALNSFYFFLSYTKLSTEKLMYFTVKIVLSLISPELGNFITIFLIVDDTLQPKFGEKFDCYGKHFDHAKHDGTNFLYGHCFVSLAISIPLLFNGKIRYLTIPVGYQLYDKSETKLEIASKMIVNIMPLLSELQVIVLCDSWYTKNPFVEIFETYKNLHLIGAVRSDTCLYELSPAPTGKKGRPRKKGEKLNFRNFEYEKLNDYYVATRKVMTNLFPKPVYSTVTTTETERFTSARLYICTIEPGEIKFLKFNEVEDISCPAEKLTLIPYCVYKLRWNIEVIFYQHKRFWSFGNYMVRNQCAIERFVNLLCTTYTLVMVFPFIHPHFSNYKFQSPQETRYAISYQIAKELILRTFVRDLEISKIKQDIIEAINSLIDSEGVA